MNRIGVVVLAGHGPATVTTLDSLRRQQDGLASVVIVHGAELDARLAEWLRALGRLRRWQVVRATADAIAGRLAEGCDALDADWAFLLEAGDTLTPHAVSHLLDVVPHHPAAAFVSGAVRLVSTGLDEVHAIDDPSNAAAFEPAHPCLRGLCWRWSTAAAAGGFDRTLPAAFRYELWLRLLGGGATGVATGRPLVQVSVEDGASLPEEVSSTHFAAAARAVRERHHDLLASHARAVLLGRISRVATLGPRHARARLHEAATGASDIVPPSAADIGRRASPVSIDWGYERGGPIDRLYIERFLARHAGDIHGAVLEVQEPGYTRRFGGARVTRSDVIDINEDNTGATLLADLRAVAQVPDETYDCIVLTQTLHVVAEMSEVVAECHRLLRPGGVLLATLPAVSRVCLEYGRDGDFWRATPAGARYLAERAFGPTVETETFGNVLASTAFLYGLGVPEAPSDLDVVDPYNPTVIGVRAVRQTAAAPVLHGRPREARGVVLLYHRVGGDDPDPHGLSIDAAAFDEQMAWLAKSCAVLTVGDLVEGARERRLPARAVAITFDDGYLDTLTKAAPCVTTRGLPATCFVATDGLEGPHVFWWDRLAAAFMYPGGPPTLRLALPDREWTFATSTVGERLNAHAIVYDAIVGLGDAERRPVVDAVERWAGVGPAPDCRRMTADEVIALSAAGFEIGAHTVTHPVLPRLAGARQAEEISESRRALERIIGKPVTRFAYPFGAHDDSSCAAVHATGLSDAFTCEARAVRGDDNRLRLPRVDVRPQPLGRFMAAVTAHLEAED